MKCYLEGNRMSAIMVKQNVFLLDDMFGKKHTLLDCNQLLSNKSRIPMHFLTEGRTIPRFLCQLYDIHKEQWKESSAVDYFLFDIILASFLIRQSRPWNVVEIGGDDGMLSYHLASLLGGFHKESFLCSVCNVIGNDSKNRWLDRISMVQETPELSFLVTDYEKTRLLSNYFDIVVVNGTINFFEPYLVFQEAERLVKNGGIIITFLQDMPLVEDSFKLYFPKRKEYYLRYGEGVLVKEEVRQQKETKEEVRQQRETKENQNQQDGFGDKRAEAEKLINTNVSPEQVRSVVQKIDLELKQAIAEYNVEQKKELIDVKEILLDYIVRKPPLL